VTGATGGGHLSVCREGSQILGCDDTPRADARKEMAITATNQEFTAEQVGWRFAIGTTIIVVAYAAWPLIPLVVAADIDPGVKAAVSGLLGATPFLSKFVAIAVMGRPAYYFLKRTVYARLRRRFARTAAD
jgi:hypothetical protein